MEMFPFISRALKLGTFWEHFCTEMFPITKSAKSATRNVRTFLYGNVQQISCCNFQCYLIFILKFECLWKLYFAQNINSLYALVKCHIAAFAGRIL